MNKLVLGLTIASTLAIAAGCTDEGSVVDEAQTGNVAFALTDGDYSIGVDIDIFEVGDLVTPVDAVTSLIGEAGPLVVDLPPGDYVPDLTSWEMTGPEIAGTATDEVPLNVVFEGFSVSPFTVLDGDTTAVSLAFTVSDVPVVITTPEPEGIASFTATISEACGPDPACGGAEVCAEFDGGDPACVIECDPTTPPVEGDECDGGECTATDGDLTGFCGVVT